MMDDQQLSPGEFLDRMILLLAARHGADPNYRDVDGTTSSMTKQQQYASDQEKRWSEVARDMQAMAKSPSCRSGPLRIVSPMVVDSEAFSASSCVHRAKFALYRLEKEAAEQKSKRAQQRLTKKNINTQAMAQSYVDPRDPKPSGFDITRHSIADAVQKIMDDARERIAAIPNPFSDNNNGSNKKKRKIIMGDLNDSDNCDDDDDDDDSPVEIYKPPGNYHSMTEEETKRAVEEGNAEEELLGRVRKLQMDHFMRFRRWLNLGTGELSDIHPETKAALMMSPDGSSSSSSASKQRGNNSRPPVEALSADDVAEMLGRLNLGEHVARFRRTTGKLLASMSKDDVRIRFDNDPEATDILWFHLETNMSRSSAPISNTEGNRGGNNNSSSKHNNNNNNNSGTTSKASSQMKAIYDAIAAPSDDLLSSTQELDEFESRAARGGLRDQLRAGSFSALKRTLDVLEGRGGESAGGVVNTRPPRPSEQQHPEDYEMNDGDNNNNDLADLTNSYMGRVNNDNNNASKSGGGASGVGKHNSSSSSAAASGRGAGGRGGGGAGGRGGGRGGVVPSASPAAPTSGKVTEAPSRGSRWAVMEYDDEDDE